MRYAAVILLSALMWTGVACGGNQSARQNEQTEPPGTDSPAVDSLRVAQFPVDSLPEADRADRYSKLSDEDFEIVADELGVEVAAIKAVVEIEAGKAMKGFAAPGVPVINFDASMYRIYRKKAPDRSGDKNAKVPAGLSGYALREWTQLTNARKKNSDGADMGTFWGMFQIGGFNYKLCGCKTVKEFVAVMSESEFSQLELFAKFISATGYLADLKAKNWAGFARKYNGAGYRARGYHTRMAAAYKKYSKNSGK